MKTNYKKAKNIQFDQLKIKTNYKSKPENACLKIGKND